MGVRSDYPTSAFDYELPPELIAHFPSERRGESRLLTLDSQSGELTHRTFSDLVGLIPAGDALVLNETRVFPARLIGRRGGGGEAEVFLLRPLARVGGKRWEAMVRPGSKLRPGRTIEISDQLSVEIIDILPSGTRVVQLITPLAIDTALDRYGQIPLPPYIDRAPEALDLERYQTIFARERGSVAAPTAGLHLTDDHLRALDEVGVEIVRIVLHVGVGTFRPVEVEDPAEHIMHQEYYDVPDQAAAALNQTLAAGGKIWAVGTTVARTLEAVADRDGTIHAGRGMTDLFIRPPYQFLAVDRLITNFHLPRSTLLMLVAALAGYEQTMNAYRVAIEAGYNFYSYGDAMLIS